TAALPLAWNSRGDSLPDLAPVVFQVPATIKAPPNPQIQVSWAVTNQGGLAAGFWGDVVYFSTRSNFDSSAAALVYHNAPTTVDAGATYWGTNQIQLPVVQSGFYYLILVANAYQLLAESDSTNNQLVAGFTFEATPADLAPVSLVVTSSVTG